MQNSFPGRGTRASNGPQWPETHRRFETPHATWQEHHAGLMGQEGPEPKALNNMLTRKQTVVYRMDKQGPMYSIGNCTQHPVLNHNVKEDE